MSSQVYERVTANAFPMTYLTVPAGAQELVSKVEGAEVVEVSKDFPRHVLKAGKAAELRSKWVAPAAPPEPWEGWFMDEL